MENSSTPRLSQEKTIEFIKLYQAEECLWNTLHEDYKIKYKRKEAAQRIVQKLNMPNFQLKHAIYKFKNLRNSYTQELKKIAHSKTARDEHLVYKPKVWWFNHMDFIRPHLQHRVTMGPRLVINGGVIKREPEAEPSEYTEELWELESEDNPSQDELHEDAKMLEGNNNEDAEHRTEKRRNSVTSGSGPFPKRSCPNYLSSEALKDISSQIASINASVATLDPRASRPLEKTTDLYDHFGEYIASLMRNLPMRKAMKLQPRIVQMIVSAIAGDSEDENEDP